MPFDPKTHVTKLKGKDYLEVKWRLVWFRDVWPHGVISTEPVELTDQRAVFRATVIAMDADGVIRGSATGTKSETPRGFPDYIEKAETGSIGRALAALGFGTQFDPALDEGERVVDSPVEPRQDTAPASPAHANDWKRENARLHAVAAERGVTHDEISAFLKIKGIGSTRDATAEQLAKLTGLIDGTGDPDAVAAFAAWLARHREREANQTGLTIDLPAEEEARQRAARHTRI